MDTSDSDLVQKAVAGIEWGDTLQGLIALESNPSLLERPVALSYLAYCRARERGQYRDAIRMCERAIAAEPGCPAHYLNLGRVYILTRQKTKAIATLRKGLSRDAGADKTLTDERARQQALILAELRRLGIRRRPPIPSLPRDHVLNRVVGKLLTRLRIR